MSRRRTRLAPVNRWRRRRLSNFFYKNDNTIALLQSPSTGWNVIAFEKGGLRTTFVAKNIRKEKAIQIAQAYMRLN